MLSPADIQKKQFARGMRGYREEEVDTFLEALTTDLGTLIRENESLRETCKVLQAEVDRFRSSEHAIFDTLESAKGLMRDISSSAEKRAEILLKNAELDAERMQREARENVERITEEPRPLSQ